MPFAVIVAAYITYRPDAKLTWILAMPFLILAFMFAMDYDLIHLVAWYGGEDLLSGTDLQHLGCKGRAQFYCGLRGWRFYR